MKSMSFTPTPLVSLVRDLRIGRFNFNHPYQRQTNQWTDSDKYLLIDSIVKNYPINPIYVVEIDKQDYVIDGGNRLSVINDFLNNKLQIPSTWPQISTDQGWISISGKTFSELSKVCRDRILSYPIQICNLRDTTSEDLKEIFARINNGIQITNAQMNAIFIPEEILPEFNAVMEHKIFDIILSETQKKKAINRNLIIRIIMILDNSPLNLFDNNIRKYISNIDIASKNNDKETINKVKLFLSQIKNSFDFLFENLDNIGERINIYNLPFICYSTNLMFEYKKDKNKYLEWLKEHLDTYDKPNSISKAYTSKNIKKEIEFYKNIIKKLD